MIDLRNLSHIKGVQANLRAVFGTSSGKEVMALLEQICGWYDFTEQDKDRILMSHGKRQVLAMLKNLIDLKPEEIQAIVREQ